MDRIFIKDLFTRCVIGVNDDERCNKQDVLINIDLLLDLRTAGCSDRLEDTVNYSALKKRILTMVDNSSFHLVEALAENIAEMCLVEPLVVQVQVKVEKPTALRFARSVGVEITRERE